MLKNGLLFLIILFISGCGGGDSAGSPDGPSIPPITTVSNTIQGRWILVNPDGGCTETYQFNSDLSWEMTFNDQVSRGTYLFQEQVNEGDKHSLTFNITSHAPNPCGPGSAIIATMIGSPPYFVSFPEKNKMSWFRAVEGVDSVGEFVMDPIITLSPLPKVVNYGDLVSFQVTTKSDTGYIPELLYGPDGMSISPAGEVTWVAKPIAFSQQQQINFAFTIAGLDVIKQAMVEVNSPISVSAHATVSARRGHDDIAVANFISKQVKSLLLVTKEQVITLLNKQGEEYIQQWVYPYSLSPNKVTHYDFNQNGLHNIIAMTTDKVVSINPLTNESEFVLPIELFEQVYGTQFVDFAVDDIDSDGDADIVFLLSCGNCNFDFKGVILVWDTGSQSISHQQSLLSQPSRIKIGSVTGDGSKQIVLNNGAVFDIGLNLLEWQYSSPLGELFTLADVDNDDADEIILYEPKGQYVDDNIQIVKYGINTPIEKLILAAPICSLHVANLNIDNDKIILTGSCIGRKLTTYSATDMQFLWDMSAFSSSSITSADIDGDGDVEIFGTGSYSIVAIDISPSPWVSWDTSAAKSIGSYHSIGNVITEDGEKKALFYDLSNTWDIYSFANDGQRDKHSFYSSEFSLKGRVSTVDVFDANSDGITEVVVGLVSESGNMGTLFSKELSSGATLWQKEMFPNQSQITPPTIKILKIENADINSDGYSDLIVVNSYQLKIEDLNNQSVIWNYQPKGYINILDADIAPNVAGQFVIAITALKKGSDGEVINVVERFIQSESGFVLSSSDFISCSSVNLLANASELACVTPKRANILILDNALSVIGSFTVGGEIKSISQPLASNNILIGSCDGSANPFCSISMRSSVMGGIIWQSPALHGAVSPNSMQLTSATELRPPSLNFATENAMYLIR
ncbi:hypothetical protein L2755_08585 [Shewanella abyssi]|uniref:hypothetical protein n=1 Tax=Shewanella abyssi TaxID=311789 RepID=UPI00200BA202|nr:hypothetical protein [Shewanella abyssi]MCL1049674.1 hypothetical protein [Shewanella abyssi]